MRANSCLVLIPLKYCDFLHLLNVSPRLTPVFASAPSLSSLFSFIYLFFVLWSIPFFFTLEFLSQYQHQPQIITSENKILTTKKILMLSFNWLIYSLQRFPQENLNISHSGARSVNRFCEMGSPTPWQTETVNSLADFVCFAVS